MDKRTLLAVDDAEINRKILSKLFSSDFNVLEATDGKEALEVIAENKGNIDVVILDIIMPKFDGFYFLEKIKETDFSDIPVVIATTDNSPEAEERLLDLGATDLIYKPFNPQNAVKRVKAILARRESEKEKIKSKSKIKVFFISANVFIKFVSQHTFGFVISSGVDNRNLTFGNGSSKL